MVGVVTAAEALKAQRLEREARHREFLAAEERRALAEQRRHEEAARVRALDSHLVAWRKASTVREYAAAMRKTADAAGLLLEDTPMTTWLAWVDAYADHIDPKTGTPSVPADPQPHTHTGYGLREPVLRAEGTLVTAPLLRPLKRELLVDETAYRLLLTADRLTLTPKGKRKCVVEITWDELLSWNARDTTTSAVPETARSSGTPPAILNDIARELRTATASLIRADETGVSPACCRLCFGPRWQATRNLIV